MSAVSGTQEVSMLRNEVLDIKSNIFQELSGSGQVFLYVLNQEQ